MGKKKLFKRIEEKRESILCDWLWRDSIPCIFSHPDTIVIPREYATTLVIIPAYIVSPNQSFYSTSPLPSPPLPSLTHHRIENFRVFFYFWISHGTSPIEL